jgi:hypothetical protein
MTPTAACQPVADALTAFLVHLPRIHAHARFAFRHVLCPHARADLRDETVALAWKHFALLARTGRHPERFVTTLALRCTQAVRAGRRLCCCESPGDVLTPAARARHGFTVSRLGTRSTMPAEVTLALADTTRSRVPDQAAFRIDFPQWRALFRHPPGVVAQGHRPTSGGRTKYEWFYVYGFTRGSRTTPSRSSRRRPPAAG